MRDKLSTTAIKTAKVTVQVMETAARCRQQEASEQLTELNQRHEIDSEPVRAELITRQNLDRVR